MAILPRSPGIYQILCIPTGKVYVGSTNNLRARWVDHRKRLRGNCHTTLRLQRAWNKYGEEAFEFQILELVMFPECLVAREQHWIDETKCYMPDRGFNVRTIADRNTGIPRSAETREKIRQASLGKKQSPETKAKRSAVMRGRKPSPRNIEARRQASLTRDRTLEKSSKWYRVTPPGGESFVIKNLRRFCREQGLRSTAMQRILSGELRTHKGWKCERV